MKPIENGCTAIVIGAVPENMGLVVTVGDFIGEKTTATPTDIWEVDKPLLWTNTNGDPCGTYYEASEKTLFRIDDDPEESDIETKEELREEV